MVFQYQKYFYSCIKLTFASLKDAVTSKYFAFSLCCLRSDDINMKQNIVSYDVAYIHTLIHLKYLVYYAI